MVAVSQVMREEVEIPAGGKPLKGTLTLPLEARGIVLFAHGSGSSRHSPRNRQVANEILHAGCATLLFDLLTRDEEGEEAYTAHLRFDIGMLAERLADATHWLAHREETRALRPGYFGASTGAGAALTAAATVGKRVGAVVSRGGRPDLAGPALPHVMAPTLLIVGGLDIPVITLNQEAYEQLRCTKELRVVPGATHLFEEPGTLDQVATLAAGWFRKYLS